MRIKALSAALIFGLAACGGDDAADQPTPDTPDTATEAPTGEPGHPDWFVVDEDAQTVTIELVAGQTSAQNHWNFNGYLLGDAEIIVPEGYEVTIEFSNEDPGMGHSVGVGERASSYPSSFSSPQPVFEGAMSSNPTSMSDSTMPGESETLVFTVDSAGEYALICYVTGHAQSGMVLDFTVSDDGTHGVVVN